MTVSPTLPAARAASRSRTAAATAPAPRPAPRPAARPAPRPTAAARTRVRVLDRRQTSYYLVVGPAGVLVLIGLVMVLSASSVTSFQSSHNSYALFERQLMWVCLGLPVALVASRLPLPVIRRLALPALVVSVLGLFAVLAPGLGVSSNGATRWVGSGSFIVQPSELAKLGLALWGADLLARRRRRLTDWKHLFIPLLPVGALLALLVMLEPDLGTTIVLLIVLMALLWVVGVPGRIFGLMALVVAALGTALAVASPYRADRLTSYLHPFQQASGNGFQAVQGIYALSSGGWWGKGLGGSLEKWDYLPNAHTDFIFAIIGEELGLLGTVLVLALFAILGYAGIRIATRSNDLFVRLAAAGITAWLVGQAVVNVGAVVGLLPITGIPLPLISFGGSSLLPTMTAVGLLAAFARAEGAQPRPRAAAGGPARGARR